MRHSTGSYSDDTTLIIKTDQYPQNNHSKE